MAQNGFSVEVEVLQNEVNAMYGAADQAKAELDSLMSAMEELNGSWSGPSNMTFRQAFRRSYIASEEACKKLRKQIETIEDAGTKYRNCENTVLQKVKQL